MTNSGSIYMSINELIVAYLVICAAAPWVFPKTFR